MRETESLVRGLIRDFLRASAVVCNRKSQLIVHKYTDCLNLSSPGNAQVKHAHVYGGIYEELVGKGGTNPSRRQDGS